MVSIDRVWLIYILIYSKTYLVWRCQSSFGKLQGPLALKHNIYIILGVTLVVVTSTNSISSLTGPIIRHILVPRALLNASFSYGSGPKLALAPS